MAPTTPKKLIHHQPDESFSLLSARFATNGMRYKDVLVENVLLFIRNIARSTNTNVGYLFSCVMTAINFIAAKSSCFLELRTSGKYKVNPNTYMIFMGPPTSGKSSAIKTGIMNPFKEIGLDDDILTTATTSALANMLVQNGSAFMVNSEIHEILKKKIDSSMQTHSGEITMLNNLCTVGNLIRICFQPGTMMRFLKMLRSA